MKNTNRKITKTKQPMKESQIPGLANKVNLVYVVNVKEKESHVEKRGIERILDSLCPYYMNQLVYCSKDVLTFLNSDLRPPCLMSISLAFSVYGFS